MKASEPGTRLWIDSLPKGWASTAQTTTKKGLLTGTVAWRDKGYGKYISCTCVIIHIDVQHQMGGAGGSIIFIIIDIEPHKRTNNKTQNNEVQHLAACSFWEMEMHLPRRRIRVSQLEFLTLPKFVASHLTGNFLVFIAC